MKTGFYTVAGPFERWRGRFLGRLRTTFAAGVLGWASLGMNLGLGLALGTGAGISTEAQAVDGCKVLLCMAGNWRRIAPCEPTVRQALRDVARGRGWPQCGMSSGSETANQFFAPVNCPEQYRTEHVDRNDRVTYGCPYSGVVLVVVDGQPWTRTWWSMDGDTVVEWLPAARAAFARNPEAMDSRFDDDHAAWVIAEGLRRAADPGPVPPGP